MTLIMVPTYLVEKYRKQTEKERARKARFDAKRTDRSHGKKKGSHHGEPPFIGWDGEGPQDTGYSLFGSSAGHRICYPQLSTVDCLDLVLQAEEENPDAIHVGFGFNYDVSMILKDLSWRNFCALKYYNRTRWHGYSIEHVPHKWFKVSKDGISARIFDIRSFFAGNYVAALDEWRIGTAEERDFIRAGKERRDLFQWSQIESIKDYWRVELSLLPKLADSLRTAFRDAGYMPKSWHGPGALARLALSRHHVYDAMGETPGPVRRAAQYGFFGGRFELLKAGHVKGKLYVADINSAYPAMARQLPDLSKGRWQRTRQFRSGQFGIWHIEYHAKPNGDRIYPLPRRMANGTVVWPNRVTGWYWTPEAELVANNPDARILDGWVFNERSADRPFEFLTEYYRRRRVLKNARNPAQYTFKLIINSIYGQLAQRTGWDKKNRRPPRSHQLEWAGYITSACRAEIYRQAIKCGEKLVSIDTDGIVSLAPFDNLDIGEGLGQWETEEYDDGIFWQSGVYALMKDGKWTKARTRGVPKGSYSAEHMLECLHLDKPLKMMRKTFVTYGLAFQGRRNELNTWKDEPHDLIMGGNGKRLHFKKACATHCNGDMHNLSLALPEFNIGKADSYPHYLPWLDNSDGTMVESKNIIDDMTFYETGDEELKWILTDS